MMLATQLLLLVLCTLSPEDMSALITTTFQYVDHVCHNSSKSDVGTILMLVFHIIILLPLRVIVAVSLYYASALSTKKPSELTSTTSAAPLTLQKGQLPTIKVETNMAITKTPAMATTGATINTLATIVPKPLFLTATTPVSAAAVRTGAVVQEEISVSLPFETDKTIPRPIAPKTLTTSPVIEEMPVLPEEKEVYSVTVQLEELPNKQNRPVEIPSVAIKPVAEQEETTPDDPVSPIHQQQQKDVVVVPDMKDILTIPTKNVKEKHAPSVETSHHFVQPSAETPNFGHSNSDAEAHAAEATTVAVAVPDAADASGDGDGQSELSSHRNEETSFVESNETSHTSAASSIHNHHHKHEKHMPPLPTPPIPTPSVSSTMKRDHTFGIRLSRSASSIRNKISTARHRTTKPEEDKEKQQQQQLQLQQQSKAFRMFRLPTLSKRLSAGKKEKQQQAQQQDEEQVKPHPSKNHKRFSVLFH